MGVSTATTVLDVSAPAAGAKIARTGAALGFFAIAVQRFGVTTSDGGSVQLTTLILVLTVLWALIRVRMQISVGSVILYVTLVAITVVPSIGAFNSGASGVSLTSLLFFLVTYTVILTTGRDRADTGVGRDFFRGAITAIKLGALLGVAQFVLQKVSGGFFDPLQIVPQQFLRGGFNTYYQLQTGEIKPNGVIFLEPSFLSLYCAIGVVYMLGRLFRSGEGTKRGNLLWIVILVAGLAVSASASGFVVLGAAAIPVLLSIKRNRWLVILLMVGVGVAALAGAFNAVIAKALEGFTGDTSSALRLTLPYQLIAPFWLQHPLFGKGPGAAATIIAQEGIHGLQATTSMKMLVEYGLFAAVVLAIAILRAVWKTGAPTALVVAVLAAWAIPSESLLNSTLVLLLLFALPNWRQPSLRSDLGVEPAAVRRHGTGSDGGGKRGLPRNAPRATRERV